MRKEILKVGEGLQKPGKPYIVTCHAKGYTANGFEFLPIIYNTNLTLGDLRLPTGLWKAMEHMKKGECSKIWIKPGDYGFGRAKNSEVLQWPELVKDNEELKNQIKNEEIYYEIEIVDWIVRSDLLGDGQLMKNYDFVSNSYERCGDYDDIVIDYKIIRLDKDKVRHTLDEGVDERISMIHNDTWSKVDSSSKFTFAMVKVLKSMKLYEKSNTIVYYSYLKEKDHRAIEKYSLEDSDRLIYDISFKNMLKVEDFYHDGTVYKKILRKGDGTASPFTDSEIKLNLKVAYKKLGDEDREVFLMTSEPLSYTMDEYTLPPLIRNVLKSSKTYELFELHTILKDECLPEFEDEKYGNFKESWFTKVGEVDEKTGLQNWIVFTIEMTEFETPESMHALYFADKFPRLLRMKNIATKFFKAKNWEKACKQYQRIYSHFNLKDIFNNIHHEDENSEEYKALSVEYKKLEIQTLTNILVVKSKLKHWSDIIEMSDKVLEKEPNNVKALFFRGKSLLNTQEYNSAIDLFK